MIVLRDGGPARAVTVQHHDHGHGEHEGA
jgi:hypothetical protein